MSSSPSNHNDESADVYNGRRASSEALEYRDNINHLLKYLPEPREPNSGSTIEPYRTASANLSLPRPSLFSPKSWIRLPKGMRYRTSANNPFRDSYQIEYSVFGSWPHLYQIEKEADLCEFSYDLLLQDGIHPELGELPENYITASQFQDILLTIVDGVENDPKLKPQRVSKGSSGSYFIPEYVPGSNGNKTQTRGIFKPKDEEPYGPLSPKWSKWLHRTFFPCFFGRSCLIPNLGYISEVAACVLDRLLLSYIVPYTDIIYLESDLFYRSFWQRTAHKISKKIGSFQVFLRNYEEAQAFLLKHPIPDYFEALPDNTIHPKDASEYKFYWSKGLLDRFQEELEKLVILDYLMRNTDRGADNWMIKVGWKHSEFSTDTVEAEIRIGAIDSGLAFPWKHPNEWRSFPFGWLFLPLSIIGRSFLTKTRNHYLPLLTSKYWWEQTVAGLKRVFEQDADFSERMWRKQIAVLKGQAFNVIEALKKPHSSPLDLTRRENLLIWDDSMTVPVAVSDDSVNAAIQSSIYEIASTDQRMEQPQRSTETTSLLRSEEQASETEQSRQMSGFDYNMTKKGKHTSSTGDSRVNTKTVVIERLEKVQGKRPVFTWC